MRPGALLPAKGHVRKIRLSILKVYQYRAAMGAMNQYDVVMHFCIYTVAAHICVSFPKIMSAWVGPVKSVSKNNRHKVF